LTRWGRCGGECGGECAVRQTSQGLRLRYSYVISTHRRSNFSLEKSYALQFLFYFPQENVSRREFDGYGSFLRGPHIGRAPKVHHVIDTPFCSSHRKNSSARADGSTTLTDCDHFFDFFFAVTSDTRLQGSGP
jgi:hypothetical protein